MEEKSGVVVVMVPFLAQSHLDKLLHLSRILSAHNLSIHYVGTTTHNRQAKLRVYGWDPTSAANIHFHDYQIPQFESPPSDPSVSNKYPSHLIPLFQASSNLRQPFVELLAAISPTAKRVIVIHDYMMSTVVQDVVSFANAEAYVIHCPSAFAMFSYFWDSKGRPCFDDIETQMQLTKSRTLECHVPAEIETIVSNQQVSAKFNSGNIYDTCKIIEGRFIDFLSKEGAYGSSKQWAMGPFTPMAIINDENSSKRHKVLEWLDKQAKDSVIYVSFGTTVSLSNEQIQELAIGLENSEQNFIWVLRDADKGDIFEGEVRRIELPNGFEERLEEKGLVVREWVPQLEILGHPATGGFMTHCGWNSIMESIIMGVPMATWPIHSDQPGNATLVIEVIKTGISVWDWDRQGDQLVMSSIIEKSIRTLMASEDGDEMRKRVRKLADDVRGSIKEGGVTRMEIDSFVAHITR